jgi:hypothetical protein
MPSKLQNIQTIFKNSIFRIPDYQRGYSWGEKERIALWNDIENLSSNDFHFTGIITLERATEKTLYKWNKEFSLQHDSNSDLQVNIYNDFFTPFFIVDGQQRMISIIILIFLIKESFHDKSYYTGKVLEEQYISMDGENGAKRYFFGYEKDTPSHQFLIRHIFEDTSMDVTEPETIYTHNLLEAKKFFQEKINESSVNLDDLLNKIQSRLLFNVFELDTSKVDMSLVFETLNYRGKKLSLLELFKNRMIFLVQRKHPDESQEMRDRIVQAWLIVYEWLGKNPKKDLNDDLFLKAFWVMFYNHDNDKDEDFKKWEEDIFDNKYRITGIKDNQELSKSKVQRFLETISTAIKYWFFIHYPLFECSEFEYDNYKVKELLSKISKNRYGDFLNPMIMAYFTHHDKRSETDEIVELLQEVERHNFVVYFLGGRKADTNRPHFLRLTNQYFRGRYHHMNLKHELNRKATECLNFQDAFNNIHKNKVKNQRFRDWDGIKYLLWEYEQKLKGNNEPLLESFENAKVDVIFPEGNRNDLSWSFIKRGRNKENMDKLCYSLGNLTITNKVKNPISYSELRKQLFNGSYVDKEIANTYQQWTDETILKRGLDLLGFIEVKWNVFIGPLTDKRKLLLDGVQVGT